MKFQRESHVVTHRGVILRDHRNLPIIGHHIPCGTRLGVRSLAVGLRPSV
jgi:hypothetical protein